MNVNVEIIDNESPMVLPEENHNFKKKAKNQML